MSPMDKRKYKRIDFHASAVIIQNNETISGEVENLSTRGVYVKTHGSASIVTDGDALVSIRLSDGATTLTVTIPAKIARVAEDGIAFHSPHISIYPILHLEHLFIYHKGKPQQLTMDFCEYICSMPSAGNRSVFE